jgi:hypothetical protein
MVDITADNRYKGLLGGPISMLGGAYRATVFLKSDPGAQFSVDLVRVGDNSVIAHQNIGAASRSTFDFLAPPDTPVQFHLVGTGDPALFQLLTFAYLGPAR